MLLEVDDINTYRGPAHVLRGVSINVDTDEVVALVGRNGAGRTTIIESITGLLPVRSGRIRFRDEEITSLPPHRRAKRGIGYAPENSSRPRPGAGARTAATATVKREPSGFFPRSARCSADRG